MGEIFFSPLVISDHQISHEVMIKRREMMLLKNLFFQKYIRDDNHEKRERYDREGDQYIIEVTSFSIHPEEARDECEWQHKC
jgi:hypothetical protein